MHRSDDSQLHARLDRILIPSVVSQLLVPHLIFSKKKMSTTNLSLLLERVRACPSDQQLVLAFADSVEAELLSTHYEADAEDLLTKYFVDESERLWKTSQVGLNPLDLQPKYKDTMFNSMMHLFQANKYLYLLNPLSDEEVQVKMLEMATMELDKVNKLGRTIPIDLTRWENVKLDVMKGICIMVLKQYENLYDALESMPSDVTLFEDSLPDNYWGGAGLNNMGKLWVKAMEVCKANTNSKKRLR